jgi:hypothetical protein
MPFFSSRRYERHKKIKLKNNLYKKSALFKHLIGPLKRPGG